MGPDPNFPSQYALLTSELRAGISADGEYFAAEDVDGRLSRWIEKDMARRKGTSR